MNKLLPLKRKEVKNTNVSFSIFLFWNGSHAIPLQCFFYKTILYNCKLGCIITDSPFSFLKTGRTYHKRGKGKKGKWRVWGKELKGEKGGKALI